LGQYIKETVFFVRSFRVGLCGSDDVGVVVGGSAPDGTTDGYQLRIFELDSIITQKRFRLLTLV
jgi:hypothetical protein